jgi:hypothetical protein
VRGYLRRVGPWSISGSARNTQLVSLQASWVALPALRRQLTARQVRVLSRAVRARLAGPPLGMRLLHRYTLERIAIKVCACLRTAVLVARLDKGTCRQHPHAC